MSTRATITNKDKTVYLHWDGYPEHALHILQKNYSSPKQARALLEMGNISSLGETLEDTVFYARDRGEELAFWGPQAGALDYNYIYTDGCWLECTSAEEAELYY